MDVQEAELTKVMSSKGEILFRLLPMTLRGEQTVTNEIKSDYIGKYDPMIFCRTCANVDSCLVPIFNGAGLKNRLNQKIEKYLPIQVSKEDGLPPNLCYHCAATLMAWDTLIVGCIEAEKKLNSLKNNQSKEVVEANGGLSKNIDSDDEPLIAKLKTKNVTYYQKIDKVFDEKNILLDNNSFASPQLDFNDSKFSKNQDSPDNNLEIGNGNRADEENDGNDDDDDDDDDDEHGEGEGEEECGGDCSDDLKLIPKIWLNIISCKNCGQISSAPKHLLQHERRGTCKRCQCIDCGQVFVTETNLTRHVKKHRQKDVGEDFKKFSCSICKKKFKFEDNGLAHEKICGKEGSMHKCSVCGKRFETKEFADRHWTSHHKSCVCHLCGQSFGKSESLKQHIKAVHEEVKMVCHYCGKKFSRKARLQEHLQRHTGQMEFTCHVCGKGSTNAYSFGVHLATHSQATPYKCSFCSKKFKHMKYVYLHERAVHLKLKSGKTYVKPRKPGKNAAQRTCPLCNKTFKRESAMLIHKRSVHEGKNGYICKLCGKDFKYTYLLYVHKKKHHFPESCKYICEFCQKPFPVKTELQNHIRKHTGEKPYTCSLCGKTYSFHGSLNMHMRTQHENKKNFKCTLCGSSYNFQSHLARHMASHADKSGRGETATPAPYVTQQ